MTTLLEICQTAIEEVSGFATPTTIIGNTDPDAILLKRLASRTGRELERDYTWSTLKTEHTITTVNGTASYDLPDDFRRFAQLTFWNSSEGRELLGPASNRDWRALSSGLVVTGLRFVFTIQQNKLFVTPTPTSAYTIVFDYYSKQFCESALGVDQDDWIDDTDVSRLDGDLMTLGVRYRFLARKGLPRDEEKAEYFGAIKSLQGSDTPKALVDFSGMSFRRSLTDNLPDTGYGQ